MIVLLHQASKASNAFYSSNPFFSKALNAISLENPISINLLIFPSFISGDAYFFTHYLACSVNFFLSYLYSEATTAS
jgi:hypothetical protein